jgi:hypothetical protein
MSLSLEIQVFRSLCRAFGRRFAGCVAGAFLDLLLSSNDMLDVWTFGVFLNFAASILLSKNRLIPIYIPLFANNAPRRLHFLPHRFIFDDWNLLLQIRPLKLLKLFCDDERSMDNLFTRHTLGFWTCEFERCSFA